jgi:signal transduction histidine kinase
MLSASKQLKPSKEVLKTVFLQIFLFFISLSVGISQEISFDSLNSFYQQKLASNNSHDLSYSDLESEINAISIKKNPDFSALIKPLELLAYSEKNGHHELGIKLVSNLIPATKTSNKFQAFLYFTLGKFYNRINRPVESLEYYLKASSYLSKLKANSILANAYYRIGIINLNGWNNDISIDYANKGLEALKKIDRLSKSDTLTLLGLYEVQGIAFRRTRKFEQSLYNINKAVELSTEIKDSVRLALNNGNKATIYYEKGDFDLAIPLLEKDFKTSIAAGVYNSGMNALIYLSWISLKLDNMDSLMSKFDQMQKIAQKYPITNPKSKAEYLKIGAKVAEIKGDTASANQFLRQYIEEDKIRDSINLSNDVSSLHERHLMEQEISKLELLQQTNQLQASHLKLRTALLIIIAFALLVVLWYVFTLRNKNRKIDRLNELLEAKVSERTARLMEINKELDTYLYRASHDIRRPIRTLLGLNNIAQINNDPEQMRQLFSKVHTTAISMDKMLFKLQMAYELNNSHDFEKVNIEELIKECMDDMSLEIEQHHANIKVNIHKKTKMIHANKALLRIALDNILENALLYQSTDNKEIEISTDIGNYFFYLHVRDNGDGIPEKYMKKLFNPYFKISNKTQGSGLGLFLAHRAISFLAGEITINSKVNEGSQFTIKIPINPK